MTVTCECEECDSAFEESETAILSICPNCHKVVVNCNNCHCWTDTDCNACPLLSARDAMNKEMLNEHN